MLLVITSGLLAWGERAQIDWHAARPLLIGALPGLPLGLVILDAIPVVALRLVLLAVTLAALAMTFMRRRSGGGGRSVELVAGFATGVLTTTVNANGPPTVLALQARGLSPAVFRPTTSAVLGLASAAGASLFVAAGRMTGDPLDTIVIAVPAVVVGWAAGSRMQQRVSPDAFRLLVVSLLAVAVIVTLTSLVA